MYIRTYVYILYLRTYVHTCSTSIDIRTYTKFQSNTSYVYVCMYACIVHTGYIIVGDYLLIGAQMCIHCLQAVGDASGDQNSLQHQYAGLYDSPNIDNAQKVCKHLYVVTIVRSRSPGD